jgi:hypothetical protein
MSVDIRVDADFPNHRKTKKLIQKLGFSGPTHLLFLWVAASKTRPKGHLDGMDESDIALDAQWPGEPGDFVEALLSCGYLERNGDGCYTLHGWSDHQPWVYFSEERSNQAREAAQIMWEKKRSKSAKKAGVKRTASAPHNERNAPSPTPSPTPSPFPNPLPLDLTDEAWLTFIEMRERIKHPLTEKAVKLIVTELNRLSPTGKDIEAIINQSSRNDWRDVYPLKTPMPGIPPPGQDKGISKSSEGILEWGRKKVAEREGKNGQ